MRTNRIRTPHQSALLTAFPQGEGRKRRDNYGSIIYFGASGSYEGEEQGDVQLNKETAHMLFSGGAFRSSVIFSYKAFCERKYRSYGHDDHYDAFFLPGDV